MIPDITLGISATDSDARVVTVIVSAGFVCRTVTVDNAFRFAFPVGVSKEIRRTRADTLIADLSCQSSPTAWVGVARISNDRFS